MDSAPRPTGSPARAGPAPGLRPLPLSPALERLRTITASKIETWLICPLKFRYTYLDKLEPAFTPAALAYGVSVHAAVEWFHVRRLAGRKPGLDEVQRIFRADWHGATVLGDVRFSAKETDAALADSGAELVAAYVGSDPALPEAVEVPFEVPFAHPATREVLPLPLAGRLDLVEPGDVVVDLKTAKSKISELDAGQRLQLTAYHYAYTAQHGRPPRLRLDVLLKQKTPRLERVETTRTPRDHARLFRIAQQILRAVNAGVLPPNPGWQCLQCPYRAPCERWQG